MAPQLARKDCAERLVHAGDMMTKSYRAFISYCHSDDRLARRIHSDLENWRIDADLVGRETLIGSVPKSLRPIFRDRDDLASGGVLTEVIRKTLTESEFLIVLCSPAAAQSHYVNEEIRLFKEVCGAARIIPLIIAGEPGDPLNECFPNALKQETGVANDAVELAFEPLAADARKHADGHRQALAKVVASLLGLPFDEIAKRGARAARRRNQILLGIATVMTVLAVSAGGLAWLAESRRVVAEHNYQAALSAADSLLTDVGKELILVEGIQLKTTLGIIDRATEIIDNLSTALPDSSELQESKINALNVFAQALAAKGDHDGALARYIEAESLAEKLLAAQPTDLIVKYLLAMIRTRLGSTIASRGDRRTAIAKLEAGLSVLSSDEDQLTGNPDLQLEVATAEMMLGLLLAHDARMTDAIFHVNNASSLATKLSSGNPEEWRYRLLSITTRTVEADLLLKQGENEAALEIYSGNEEQLVNEIGRRPDMPQIRQMLSKLQANQAALYAEQGKSTLAEEARLRSIETTNALVRGDAENSTVLRERAEKLVEEAELLASRGAIMESAELFRESRETLQALLAKAPSNALVRSSLELSLSSAADAMYFAGMYQPSELAARKLLELRERTLEAAPGDVNALGLVTLALYQVARVLDSKGELQEALVLHKRLLSLEQQLASDGRDNRVLLAEAHHAVGLLNWRLSRRNEALPHYERYAELLTTLVAEQPDDEELRIQLGYGLLNLGELRVLSGNRVGALTAFTQCLKLRQTVVEDGFNSFQRLIELAWAQARLAQFGDQSNERWRQVEKLLSRADVVSPLGDMEDELLTSARIAISGATH